ncbi:hypothetical protein K461DRAFT_283334 [Myriangium duriaei CBS 260.36]|uniref:Uncharacterized protein n=1 Tax=Myriangium duriaei CBS 260.36 TaxID=1168546 RepID=A0A9P4ISC4_9PEZI|nr:hypothetical protein K461DRAFT_283334 [Myriangium duriaei CBS 260.36]
MSRHDGPAKPVWRQLSRCNGHGNTLDPGIGAPSGYPSPQLRPFAYNSPLARPLPFSRSPHPPSTFRYRLRLRRRPPPAPSPPPAPAIPLNNTTKPSVHHFVH